MKIVFFGTPAFAASILEFLLQSNVSIEAIVTQPDRPKGRSLQMTSSAVKQAAGSIPVLQPQKASEPQFLEQLKALHADLFVVVAFGQILPQSLLDIPPKGCINLHASLLPKYRGAAPIHRALIHGDRETGVCVQKMVKQLDAGDVIASARTEILPDMTFGELEAVLCELSKSLLLWVLQAYEKGIPPAEPQNPTLVTYAPKISMEEGEIKWDRPAEEIHNLVRAFSPRPGAWSSIDTGTGKKRVKILKTKVIRQSGRPGQVFSVDGDVGCGAHSLKILDIQPEGKQVMRASDWLRGQRGLPQFS